MSIADRHCAAGDEPGRFHVLAVGGDRNRTITVRTKDDRTRYLKPGDRVGTGMPEKVMPADGNDRDTWRDRTDEGIGRSVGGAVMPDFEHGGSKVGAAREESPFFGLTRVARKEHAKRFVLETEDERIVVDVVPAAADVRERRAVEAERYAVVRPPHGARPRLEHRNPFLLRDVERIVVRVSGIVLAAVGEAVGTERVEDRGKATDVISASFSCTTRERDQMPEVWAYCRVSTLKTEQELSLEEQSLRAEKFARNQDCTIKIFVERKSAKSLLHRPVLTKLLEDLESLKPRQRPKFVYATAFDRMGRDMADCVYIGHQCRRLSVGLWIGNSEFKLNTFAERMNFVGQSIGGDAENEARSRRSRDSWDRRRREGKPTSNKVPYGLQLKGERDVAIPDSGPWVLNAFQWYAEGIGSHTIGKRMDGHAPPHTWLTTRIGEDGERIQKTRAGTRWESLRVMKLLRQRRYRDTIVPPELFDAVQAKLSNTPKYGSRTEREYPLTSAMRCKTCGRHLHGRATGHSSSYRLVDGTQKVSLRTPLRYYACVVCHYMQNAERLERQFFADIAHLAVDEALLKRWIAAPRLGSADASSLRREIKKLESEVDESVVRAKRDRLVDAMMATMFGNAEFERQIQRLETELEKKRSDLAFAKRKLEGDASSARTVERARELLSSFDRIYRLANYDDKRELVSAVTDALGGLVVSKDGLEWKSGKRLEPNPAKPKSARTVR